MQPINRIIIASLAVAVTLNAAGKQNPTPTGTVEVRVSNEMVPAGGTVQAKFLLTEPHPISSTGTGYALDGMSVDGVAVWSPDGAAGGVGLVKNGSLYLAATSPTGSLGTGLDYPFVTITSDIPASVKAGTSYQLTWSSDSWLTASTGPLVLSMKPGKLVVGGSLSIRGVYPGGGTWPAGSLVRILGLGFQAGTRVTTTFKTATVVVVNPNEIDLVLKEQTALDSQKVTVTNPDNSTDTYFAYLRGVLIQKPSRTLLQNSEPAFPLQTHALASLVVPALTPSQFAAFALQNPNTGPLVVTFQLVSTNGGTQSTSFILPSGARLMNDLSNLLGGVAVNSGDTVQITSTAPLQILGLLGDEGAVTMTPFFPTF